MQNLLNLLVLVCLLGICCPLSANATATGSSASQDTIFIKIGEFQEKVFQHTIKKGETLFSIAKFYGLDVNELYFYNPVLVGSTISINQPLIIPLPNKAIVRFASDQFKKSDYHSLCYAIKKGDTLYGISKGQFKMPVDTLIIRNNLTSPTLTIGQILHVGWMSKSGIPTGYHKFRGSPEWKKTQLLKLAYIKGTQAKEAYEQQGVAYWDDSKKSNDFYALHRTAPLRSIIKINNPLNNKMVFAKVIGRIPDSVHTDEVVVVISSKTARALGAKDSRFFVRIKKFK